MDTLVYTFKKFLQRLIILSVVIFSCDWAKHFSNNYRGMLETLFPCFSFSTVHLLETLKAAEPSTQECWLQWGQAGFWWKLFLSFAVWPKQKYPQTMHKPNKILKSPFQFVSPAYLTILISLFQLFSKYALLWDKVVTSYYLPCGKDRKMHFYIPQGSNQSQLSMQSFWLKWN